MGIKLTEETASGGTTDHSIEIATMRGFVKDVMDTFPDSNKTPTDWRIKATICAAGAALLECHDQTGISLDEWEGPHELVIEALWIIGSDRDDFIPNGI